MGQIYRKRYTMPLPSGADIVEHDGRRVARWRLRNGQLRSGEVVEGQHGRFRVRDKTRQYYVRYRDGSNEIVEINTGCRDETAARQVLADLVKRAERIRAGLVTPANSAMTAKKMPEARITLH